MQKLVMQLYERFVSHQIQNIFLPRNVAKSSRKLKIKSRLNLYKFHLRRVDKNEN